MERETSYKQIIKSTGIFGSSQMINIVLGVFRSKLTAVFLGTFGVGIFGVLQSIIDLIRSFSGLGLDSGAIKNLASTEKEDSDQLGKTLYTINVWYLSTGVLGAILCAIFARPLGYWAFDNYDYTYHIVAISIAIFFVALQADIIASLQGLRKITFMALASTISSISTLVVMIPLYFYLEIEGIVPMMILSSVIMFLVSLFFYRRIKIKRVRIPTKEAFKRGKGMLRLGAFIVVAGVLSTASPFIVRAFINRMEGMDSVGLFQAAWVITTLFWGVVLRSTNTDFFPKLCSLIDDKKAAKQFVNEQTHVILLITSPIVIALITFSEYVLQILYTDEFADAANMLRWHLVGAFFKMVATPMATVMLAKNRGGVHLVCETIFWLVYLLFAYFFYPVFGLQVVGIAYLVAYAVYIPTVLTAGYQLTESMWDSTAFKLLIINILIVIGLYISFTLSSSYLLIVGSIMFIFSATYSFSRFKTVVSFGEIFNWIKNKRGK